VNAGVVDVGGLSWRSTSDWQVKRYGASASR